MKRYYVYLLRCSDDSFYVGVTSELEQRVGQHNYGWDPTAYTHARRPVTLVFAEDFIRVEDAIRFEKQMKGWSRKKKIAFVEKRWNDVKALARRRAGRPL